MSKFQINANEALDDILGQISTSTNQNVYATNMRANQLITEHQNLNRELNTFLNRIDQKQNEINVLQSKISNFNENLPK